jgi:hypothetical protein
MSSLSDHPPLAYQPITPINLKTYGLLERLLIAHCRPSNQILLMSGIRHKGPKAHCISNFRFAPLNRSSENQNKISVFAIF